MIRIPIFKFRLYVAGDTQNSARASANLASFCRLHLQDRHEIEVIDILRDPKRAMTHSVFMTPTLVKFAPPPERRMIGTLSQTQLISETIGLDPQHV